MYSKYVKRLLDVIISLVVLPFILIISLIIGILIYLEDKGSIFYVSKRLGKNGKSFNIYKLRSMKMHAPDIRNEDGSTYNSENDPRLTKIGKFIRKTSLDELPQFLNVLKGDMSLIGPRPDLLEDLETYTEYQRKKILVRPGITGYSQAYFRNSIGNEEKYNNDAYYVDNLSFFFDIKIFFKTIFSIIKKENVFVGDEKL